MAVRLVYRPRFQQIPRVAKIWRVRTSTIAIRETCSDALEEWRRYARKGRGTRERTRRAHPHRARRPTSGDHPQGGHRAGGAWLRDPGALQRDSESLGGSDVAHTPRARRTELLRRGSNRA